jgi:hypothetical protein
MRPMYYNGESRKQTMEDPRYLASTLEQHSDSAPRDLWIASSTLRNSSKLDSHNFKRTPISYDKSIRHQYTMIHTIDSGDGSIGGMNGGVFVVTMNGLASRIFIEKRFKSTDIDFGKREIEMLHRVNHPALTNFMAGFILENANPAQASLYMEFCDRGSLDGVIREYTTRRNNGDRNAMVPEGFIWHALVGLADGLAYLQSGVSMWQRKNAWPDSTWVPILHRDIKPDNVMLRSRATLGSNKYFYCILSDFGLACDDRDDRDRHADKYQIRRVKLGTKAYWAPELLYDPYPRSHFGPDGEDEWREFPPGHRHSRYSDLWAVGATIFNLCGNSATAMNHLNMSRLNRTPGLTQDQYLEGTASHERPLSIPHQYSQELRKAILFATQWDICDRPNPVRFVQYLEPLMKAAGYSTQGENNEPLPGWATKVHDYQAKAEKVNKSSR